MPVDALPAESPPTRPLLRVEAPTLALPLSAVRAPQADRAPVVGPPDVDALIARLAAAERAAGGLRPVVRSRRAQITIALVGALGVIAVLLTASALIGRLT